LAPFKIETRVEKHHGDKSVSGLVPFEIEIRVGKQFGDKSLSLLVMEKDSGK
jgi:hypothetical protein